MQAMILAAGFGTRLLPHTQIRPKPLFPILNQPLLLLTIKRLQNMGFDHIVVNCHHLRRQIVAALSGLPGVFVQEEEIILGTGGGLRRALGLLRDEPLLVSNGDIYHTVDFLKLYRYHENNGHLVTLALHHYPRFNSVTVKAGKVALFSNIVETTRLAFTGLHVIQPTILEEIREGDNSCIIDRYRRLLEKGVKIDCFRTDDCYWTDMGTPTDYLALHQGLLTESIPCWQEIGPVDKPYYIAENADLGARIEMNGWACVGNNARIGDECHLERVVVWDDVTVPSGSRLCNTIVSVS
ncbi:MAG: NTP transferase domain-containing protein [Proteobacteria bacterium]|nr:NTP transferase domain-containing protein [Pseudomonadota bacterium]